METVETSLTSDRGSSTFRSLPTFGPYLLLQTVPWLLLATVLRTYVKAMPNALLLLGMILVQFAVFIAFLLASQKMIELANGWTSLSRLTFREQVTFGWRVIWRLLLLFLLTVCTADLAGVDKFAAAQLWLGFDGIAYPWRQGVLQVWIAIVSMITFMFVVEKGVGRQPRFVGILREFRLHRRHLSRAVVYICAFLVAMTFLQGQAAKLLSLLFDSPGYSRARPLVYIGWVLAFSYLRLWGTIAMLTYALRESYRLTARQAP
ncbi:hypothetical protein [Sinorhizobium mexicanum]|uniref:Uncharacterized protein n=1 Tax=Sinorhizobium mexicanum TaxID=375549 RepID=A0A859QCZ8_9HYPH|nr:hypothetical protein [Sinorhizobium mexicanum]MBP1883542.1 hypothetical protein [Sinorhizobium mexicanum]QLL62733.1 hypothetical protein FKV68_15420 [Sinorhizobium mexicanum]